MAFPNDTARFDGVEIDGVLTTIRPVGTLVWDTATQTLWRSTSAVAATYETLTPVAVNGDVNVPTGSALTFDTSDVVYTSDGADVVVTGTGDVLYSTAVFRLVDSTDATKSASFNLTAFPVNRAATIRPPATSWPVAMIGRENAVDTAIVTLTGAATTPTETIFGAVVDTQIDPNQLTVGSVIRIRAWATLLDAAGVSTVTFRLRLGGIAGPLLAETAAVDGATGDVFMIDCFATIRSIGAAGTVVASAFTTTGTPGGTTAHEAYVLQLGGATIDTTAAILVNATAEFSAANSDLRLDQLIVDVTTP